MVDNEVFYVMFCLSICGVSFHVQLNLSTESEDFGRCFDNFFPLPVLCKHITLCNDRKRTVDLTTDKL